MKRLFGADRNVRRARSVRAAAAGLTPLAAALLLGLALLPAGACRGAGGPPPAGAPSASSGRLVVSGIEPAGAGGSIVVGALSGPKTLNPLVATDVSSMEIYHRIFDNLVEYDCARFEYLPGLAASWDVSADGRVWTFRLRPGVTWADGAPFGADDVLFTFRAIYDDRFRSPQREGLSLDGKPFLVTKRDSATVVIETERPFGPMLHALANGGEILPRHLWEPALEAGRIAQVLGVDASPDSVVGTGPFRLGSRDPERTVLTRNPHYWKFDRAGTRLPYADRMIFVLAGDTNGWRLKFEARGVDTYLLRPDEVAVMRDAAEASGFRTYDIGPRLGTIHMWLNQNPGRDERGEPFVDPVKLAWFQDLRFRKAVSHAIDRDAIVRTVYAGNGVPIWGPISPGDARWYNPDIPSTPYDPARARALLAEIGFRDADGDGFLEDGRGNPVEFVLRTNSESQARVQIGRLIETDLAAAGVRVRLVPVEFRTLLSAIHETYRYEACLLSTGSSGDPVSGLNVWLSSGSSHEFHPRQSAPATAWERAVDSLVTASVTTAEFAERKRLFDQVQVLFAENLGFIYLANDDIVYAVRDRLRNLRPGRVRAFNEIVWNEDEIAVEGEP